MDMRYLFLSLLISLLQVVNCHAKDYRSEQFQFSGVEEAIIYETSRITSIAPNDYEKLSDAYISRGENLLFSERYMVMNRLLLGRIKSLLKNV